jgi:hypothetical protein
MNWKIYSAMMIVLGIVYLVKPNIYRRGLWKETSIAQRKFSEKQYNIFMRAIGGILIAVGLYVILKNT